MEAALIVCGRVELARATASATRASVRDWVGASPAASSAAALASLSAVGAHHGPCGCFVAVAVRERPCDVAGALGVDQLLDDRPRQRLERLRLAQHAQLRARLHDPAEERVGTVGAMERLEVVVEREHEPQAFDRDARGVFGGGVGAQVDVIASPCRLGQRDLLVDPDRPPHDGAVDLDQPAGPGGTRRLARPWRRAW